MIVKHLEKPLKIIYMGTPDFAVPALQILLKTRHYEVVAVYTQPPRPKGRGQKIQKSPVHELAETYDIPVFTPKSLKKDPEAVTQFQKHRADIAVVAAYGLILPQTILDTPKHGCLNIHASLLPRWRGAAPIQYSIWKGDTQSGVTIMQMEAGLDTGPMIEKQTCPITQDTTAQELHDTLSDIGATMLVPILNKIHMGEKINTEPQTEEGANYASMLKKEDGKIEWAQSAQDIHQQIRALNPWPGTYCTYQEQTLKIKSATMTDQESDALVGTLLDKQGHVVCGNKSVLKLTHIQPANKKMMDFSAALNGGYLRVGDSLL